MSNQEAEKPATAFDPLAATHELVAQEIPADVDRRRFLMRTAVGGAAAVLTGCTPSPEEKTAKAVATSEQRAEIEAFASAVARRFGASGAIGQAPDKGLGPAQWLTGEEREILSGAGFVASYLKEGSLDHLIAQVLRRELDQRLDVPPQQTVDQRQDIDRDRDPGLTL